MSVRVLPDITAEQDPMGVQGKWGSVAERLADPELRAAIRSVLLYEHFKHDARPVVGVSSDIAHAASCRADGIQEGLSIAFAALCDSDYIRDQRSEIESKARRKDTTDDDRA